MDEPLLAEHQLLINIAAPELMELRDELRVTTAIGVLDRQRAEGLALKSYSSPSSIQISIAPGHRFPLHATAPGKAMLASIGPDHLEDFLPVGPFEAYTTSTITDASSLHEALNEDKKRAYSIDREESLQGVHCLAVSLHSPSSQALIGALWVTHYASHFNMEQAIASLPKVRGTAQKIIRKYEQAQASSPKNVDVVILQVRQHLTEHMSEEIDLEKLLRVHGVSYSWFRRVFKEKVGMSPHQYQIQTRIDKAKDWLKNSTKSVQSIAHDLGYHDSNTFSTLFKKKVGLSPSMYRIAASN